MGEPEKKLNLTEFELKKIINNTVEATLTQLGIDHDDPLEMQKDFSHLREWRQSTDRIKNKAFMSVVAFIVAGFVALIVLGFEHLVGKH